eukprot:13708936-Alexandrium_andersonii.AAC.1
MCSRRPVRPVSGLGIGIAIRPSAARRFGGGGARMMGAGSWSPRRRMPSGRFITVTASWPAVA